MHPRNEDDKSESKSHLTNNDSPEKLVKESTENRESILRGLDELVVSLDTLQLPSFQPIGDTGVQSVLEALEPIPEEVLAVAGELRENPDTPTDNARRRAEAKYAAKRLRLYAKYRGSYKKPQRKKGKKAKPWAKKRKKELKREHKRFRRRLAYQELVMSGEYWPRAVFNAKLNRVPWEITRQEWDAAGIEEAVANVKNPRMKRIVGKDKPWTLDNLQVFGDRGELVWTLNSRPEGGDEER